MTPKSIQAMIDQALLRNSTNRDGSHNSHEENRRNVQTARPCFYADFMKCQPLNFKRTEGVVGLTRWLEKMESDFNISGCAIENQVKFATYTLLGATLTWWNGQIRTLGPEAYAMTWEVLKKKMTDKYCPQGEIKKLEIELWNLKVKGNDVPAYTERFQELTLICTKFVANETEKVDKYISGLPDNIYGNVKSARPKTLDETIELANDLMDQKLRTYAERQSDNKRKADDSSRNNHGVLGIQRDCPKQLKKNDGGNGIANAGVMQLGMQKREEMHRETLMQCRHGQKEHQEHLRQNIELLKKSSLYTKFSKCEFWIPKEGNVVADAWAGKERIEPLRVRALVMTIGLDLPKRILEAQIEAQKLENLVNEDVGGIIRRDIPKERLEPHVDGILCLHSRS
ncbi:reverse transcriptase domain-containing protein [Tanacetum coccineum]